jgi:hypothetical protein
MLALVALVRSPAPPSRARSSPPNSYDSFSIVTNQSSDADEIEEIPSQGLTLVLTVAVLALIIGIAMLYLYCQKKFEEDQNPEYTRAILGDDAFEFSKMDAL